METDACGDGRRSFLSFQSIAGLIFLNIYSSCLIPSGGRHDAASVLSFGLAAALHVVSHAKVVAHFVSHGGGDTNC